MIHVHGTTSEIVFGDELGRSEREICYICSETPSDHQRFVIGRVNFKDVNRRSKSDK